MNGQTLLPAKQNPCQFKNEIEEIYRVDSRRIFASLVRLLRDFDAAEEAMQEAFAAAFTQWEQTGIPANPRAWLVSTGRFKAIDSIRRRQRFGNSASEVAKRIDEIATLNAARESEDIEDDRLRLIFTCCHPAIDPKVQLALTLREVCGLTTEEVASAFLLTPSSMAQRLVRGKAKIREAGIPFAIPSASDFQERLDSVLAVVYLIFNEGYSASSGDSLTRAELSFEAIRLGRLLVELLPDPEAIGLLALMLFQESRHKTRANPDGDLVLLEDQDRSQWDAKMIAEGLQLISHALSTRRFGAYGIQAAIAAVHASAKQTETTDWAHIVALYSALFAINPSPVIELNWAVAIAMKDGPAAGIEKIESIFDQGHLEDYHLAHAAKADLLRRLGRNQEAKIAYEKALALVKQEPERRFLQNRLANLPN